VAYLSYLLNVIRVYSRAITDKALRKTGSSLVLGSILHFLLVHDSQNIHSCKILLT